MSLQKYVNLLPSYEDMELKPLPGFQWCLLLWKMCSKNRAESGPTLGVMQRGATKLFRIIQKQKQFKFRVQARATRNFQGRGLIHKKGTQKVF